MNRRRQLLISLPPQPPASRFDHLGSGRCVYVCVRVCMHACVRLSIVMRPSRVYVCVSTLSCTPVSIFTRTSHTHTHRIRYMVFYVNIVRKVSSAGAV